MKPRNPVRLAFVLSVWWGIAVLSGCGGGATETETGAVAASGSTAAGAASAAVDGTAGVLSAAQVAASARSALQVQANSDAGNTIYVSLTGNDSWSGRTAAANAAGTDGPVRTLAAAQALVRGRLARMAAGEPRQPVRVRIMPGQYYLSAPLVLTPADSGTPEAPVYYEAVKAHTVVVSGGVPLTRSANAAPAGQVRFDVPSSAGTGWNGGSQLYVNGKRAVLARQPNAGQPWFVKAQIHLPGESGAEFGRQAFTASAEAHAWITALNAADRSRAIVKIMQSWTDGHHRLSDLPTTPGTLRITPKAIAPFKSWGLSQRFWVENVAAALDAPGEWLWDAGGVRYVLGEGESAENVSAVMPVLEKLVVVQGDLENRNWVQNLWLSGITFAHTRHLLPAEGATDTQAAVDVGAAIEVDGAVGIVVDYCKFEHTGGYGLWFRRAARDSRVTNSTFDDLGAGGIRMGQAYQAPNELPSGANSAVGNRVSNTGKLFKGAVGIWVGQGYGNLVSHNAVFNTTYTGISAGWTWGYGEETSGRNRILNNLLHNIGQADLSDMGGIYVVGISPGTVVSGNMLREIRSYPGYGAGAWGLHGDEGISHVLMENNIVVGTDSGGFGLNFGRDLTLRNNLFAYGIKFELRVTNSDPDTRLLFQDNLLMPLVQQPFDEYAMPPDVLFSGVRVSDHAVPSGLDLRKCGGGCSVVSTAVTVGEDPRHIRIADIDSATAERYARIARESGPSWMGSSAVFVEVPVVPPVVPIAPPAPLTLDIANAPVGSQPEGLVYQPADGSVIGVVRDPSAPDGSCIAFNDSASFPWSFFPYVYTSLNHERGTSTVEFALKIDANTAMGHEWRDGGNPYKTGPALFISPAGVVANGRNVAPAPVGQWLTFRISAKVDDPNATWTLKVVQNATGAETTVDHLAFASAGWTQLIMLGFMSDATTNSTACLGSLRLTSSILH